MMLKNLFFIAGTVSIIIILFGVFSFGVASAYDNPGTVSIFGSEQIYHDYTSETTTHVWAAHADANERLVVRWWTNRYADFDGYYSYNTVQRMNTHTEDFYNTIPYTVADYVTITAKVSPYHHFANGVLYIYKTGAFGSGGSDSDVATDWFLDITYLNTSYMDEHRDTSVTKEFYLNSPGDFGNIRTYYYYWKQGSDLWTPYEKNEFGFALGRPVMGTRDVGAAEGGSMLRRSTWFVNDYEIEDGDGYKQINVTRAGDSKFDGASVSSKITAYNPDGSVFVDYTYSTANTTHILPQAGYEIVLTAYDFQDESKVIWDDTETVSGDYRLYGYVFDAADKFLLNNTVVSFASDQYTTSEDGYYEFNRDYSGSYLLSATKTGYQPLNDGDGVYANLTATMRLNIPLIKNVTVNSGTCTVAGIVLDDVSKIPIGDVLVRIENTSYDSYVYTNEMGYFVFYDLSNTTYALSGSKEGYYNSQMDINLTDLDTAYYYQVNMVSEDAVAPAPTSTPTPGGDATVEGWKTIFDMMGLGDYMGYIMAFLCMAVMGFVGGKATNGNTMGVMMGFFFGYIIDVAIGWLPMWTVAVAICVTVYFVVKGVAR